ncbi:MAG: calcium-binding protein [Frankiales bacterium]|nr:calcium-binding protein [Frankiales bacterium]
MLKTAAATSVLLAGMLVTATAAAAAAPAPYTNCTSYNKKFPHGVGRSDARDKTSGTPVTTFRRHTAEYKRAMAKNSGLDRDKDGIACEKR